MRPISPRSRRASLLAPSLASVALLAATSGPVAAADLSAGRKAAGQCTVCHGKDGIATNPEAPNLAGEASVYIEKQLKAFRSGERQHRQMSIVAQGLDDATIKDLAAWYESLVVEVAGVPEAGPAGYRVEIEKLFRHELRHLRHRLPELAVAADPIGAAHAPEQQEASDLAGREGSEHARALLHVPLRPLVRHHPRRTHRCVQSESLPFNRVIA